jgi:hypothetical protein
MMAQYLISFAPRLRHRGPASSFFSKPTTTKEDPSAAIIGIEDKRWVDGIMVTGSWLGVGQA